MALSFRRFVSLCFCWIWIVVAAPARAQAPRVEVAEAPRQVIGPAAPPAFSLQEKRIWPGETLSLEVIRHGSKPVRVEHVRVRDVDGHWGIDLTTKATPAADGSSLGIKLAEGEGGIADHSFAWKKFYKWYPIRAALCIEYAAEGEPAGKDPLCGDHAENVAVQAIEVELGSQKEAAIRGVGVVALLIIAFNVVLLRSSTRVRAYFAQHAPGWYARALYWFLRPATTPMGTYSLSTAQILLWTYVTLFGLVYVWSMSEGFLKISPDILELLGIGSATALFAGAASRARTYVPRRYRELVVKRDRVPQLGDLITVDGVPSVFKLQMLAFTVVAAFIVAEELVVTCAFPVLPGELITLMGISSLTYAGNETLQRDTFEEIKALIAKIEDHAQKAGKPFHSRKNIEALQGDPDIKDTIEELRLRLAEIYSADPAPPGTAPQKTAGPSKGRPEAIP